MNNPSSPRHGPRPSNGGGSDAAAAALKGASLAFSKSSKPKPVPPPKHVRGNSALSAATTSASRDRSRSRSPAPPQSRQTTGGSFRAPPDQQFGRDGTMEGGNLRDRLARLGTSPTAAPSMSSAHLQPASAGGRPTSYDPKNPSFIAATLAASRSVSPSPQNKTPSPAHHASVPNMRAALAAARGRPRRESVESSSMSSIELPDTSSIAPTTSLISMFEGPRDDEDDDMDPVKKSPAPPSQKVPVARPKVKPPLRPMTPERTLSPKEDVTPTRAPAISRAAQPSSPMRSEAAETTPRPKPKPKLKAKPQESVPHPIATGALKNVEPPLPRKPSAEVSPPRAVMARHQGEARDINNVSYLKPQQSGRRSQAQSVSPTRKQTRPKSASIGTLDHDPGVVASRKPQKSPVGSSQAVARVPPSAPAPKPRNLQLEPDDQPEPRVIRSPVRQVVSPQPTRRAQPKLRPPTPPQPRGAGLPSREARGEPEPMTPPQLTRQIVEQRNVNSDARPTTSGTTSSNDTFVSASSIQTPVPRSPPPRREPAPRPSSTVSMPVGSPTRGKAPPLPRRNPAVQSSSNLPLHSLSNAIMAGSLAASRLTPSNTGTSTKSLGPPPPLPRRKSPRLRQTLRQVTVSDEEESEARRIRKHHGHHSNKKHFHHEGARKRWREEIKPIERRRYEALWASNRGVLHEYLPPSAAASTESVHFTAGKDAPSNSNPLQRSNTKPDLSDYVLNIVVRDIWRRSRLPDDELSEVWELVTSHHTASRKATGSNSPLVPPGMLGKQQFVVGTFIIDQRLRGRKIPIKISASVWDSAKGVRVSSPKSGKDGAKVRK